MRGPVWWLLGLTGWIAAAGAVRFIFLSRVDSKRPFVRGLFKLFILGAAVLGTLLIIESILCLSEPFLPREKRFSIPSEWVRKPLDGHDYLWQGHLHRYNRDRFRGPDWGPKRKDTCRIIVLGDSLTYGYGVSEAQTYSSLIEQKLKTHYRVEVLNLGVSGAQSENIVFLAHRFLPRYAPDVVLYGICLNDYLPSGVSEYMRYAWFRFAAPSAYRTRVAEIFWNGSIRLLMRWGMIRDFVQDALGASTIYAERFARDVAELNRFVTAAGRPPVLAMVVHQIPDREEGLQLVSMTERIAREAGLIVVPAEDYLLKWTGRKPLGVSPWEGHPSAEAHEMFAAYFVKGLFGDPRLKKQLARFRIPPHLPAPYRIDGQKRSGTILPIQ
jgi:lysophospholipase L1-like esterase